jgi:hypothetical protein
MKEPYKTAHGIKKILTHVEAVTKRHTIRRCIGIWLWATRATKISGRKHVISTNRLLQVNLWSRQLALSARKIGYCIIDFGNAQQLKTVSFLSRWSWILYTTSLSQVAWSMKKWEDGRITLYPVEIGMVWPNSFRQMDWRRVVVSYHEELTILDFLERNKLMISFWYNFTSSHSQSELTSRYLSSIWPWPVTQLRSCPFLDSEKSGTRYFWPRRSGI